MKIQLRTLCRRMISVVLFFSLLIVNETTNKGIQKNIQSTGINNNQQNIESVVDNTQNKIVLTDDKLSLEKIHAYAQQEQGDITRGIKTASTSDKFTQSQAHMSLPEIKKLIAAEYNLSSVRTILF